MKLKRNSKLFTVIAVLVSLASALGISNGLSAAIYGQELILGLFSVALGLLGGLAVYRYFAMRLIEAWMYYVWLIPQTMFFTIDTLDFVNNTATSNLVYGTYLLPQISFHLAWELQDNSYLMANFHLLAIAGILILKSIFSHLGKDQNLTEQVAEGEATR